MCQNCLEPCRTVLRCGRCKTRTYCSAACQKRDWQYHRRNCKAPDPPEKRVEDVYPDLFRPAAKVAEQIAEEDETSDEENEACRWRGPACWSTAAQVAPRPVRIKACRKPARGR